MYFLSMFMAVTAAEVTFARFVTSWLLSLLKVNTDKSTLLCS